ncbi:MAG: hypothetical protein A2Y60_04110 [Chloroflexi bacterium RBG_13_54_9]|nr:MAG: hypothetical protein A2Y60_04110 [Chloroflexi bacterium RBG_13_54_9]
MLFKNRKRTFVSILLVLLVVSALVLPMTASAGRFTREQGFMRVPRGATEAYTLTVGEVSVTIPPGALPKGGPVILIVTTGPRGQFLANFGPSYRFQAPVMMEFGDAEVVYYHYGNAQIPLYTGDLDGDGDSGEIESEHFSRYSGWF